MKTSSPANKPAQPYVSSPTRRLTPVEVRAAKSPTGEAHVLLQLEYGYLLVSPTSARHIAEMLTEAAAEAEIE